MIRTAIVLPAGYRFSEARPNSIETVVRTLAGAAPADAPYMIFADEGASDHGDLPVTTVPPIKDRGARAGPVAAAVRAWGADLIEAHQHAPTASRLARAFPSTPVVLYRHNMTPPPGDWFSRLRYHHRLAPITAHLFVSETALADFQTDYPAFGGRAYAIPNPIDARPWQADPHDRARLIAFAGRATREKGLGLVCEALPRLLERHPDWRADLLLADWGMHKAWAEQPLQALKPLGDRVRITTDAPLAEVRSTLQRAAIVLVPSIWKEPFGLAALEAHAAGAAVVSSGAGGLREASGEHALYMDDLTTEALIRAVDRMIADPAERLRLAHAGQAHVARAHSPARRALELQALRRRIVAQGSVTQRR